MGAYSRGGGLLKICSSRKGGLFEGGGLIRRGGAFSRGGGQFENLRYGKNIFETRILSPIHFALSFKKQFYN